MTTTTTTNDARNEMDAVQTALDKAIAHLDLAHKTGALNDAMYSAAYDAIRNASHHAYKAGRDLPRAAS